MNGYTVIAIPLTAGVLYLRVVLSPSTDAMLVIAGTVIVALNAQLLKQSMKSN